MNENTKIIAFEYFVIQMHAWYKEKCGDLNHNDLSTLKLLKLLFFVTAVGINKDSKDLLIDEVFNNFCAMPYGHVESDIYNHIKKNDLINISVNNSKSTINSEVSICNNITPSIKESIDASIQLLQSINNDLIKFTPFELVELSHKWYSWKKNYEIAKRKKQFSYPIEIKEIKEEIKIYQL